MKVKVLARRGLVDLDCNFSRLMLPVRVGSRAYRYTLFGEK